MKCDSCVKHQQRLIECGTNVKVICNHLIIDEDAVVPVEETTSSSATTVIAPAPVFMKEENSSRKRKFLTFKKFVDRADEKIKRKIAPIVKWSTLTERTPYLVKNIYWIDTLVNRIPQKATYAELEDEAEVMKNVWLTDIIHNELIKYQLHEGNTYIMPLGQTKSRETGFPYFDFTIIEDKEE